MDLPPIALDDDTRKQLQVELLDAVRIRIRRRSQVTLELRESIYLIALSLFVAIAMFYDVAKSGYEDSWVTALLALPVLVVIGVVVLRFRTRFSSKDSDRAAVSPRVTGTSD